MDTKTEFRTLQHFIGGEWVDAEGGATFEDYNPLDDSVYAHVAHGTGNDMRKAIAALPFFAWQSQQISHILAINWEKSTPPTHGWWHYNKLLLPTLSRMMT